MSRSRRSAGASRLRRGNVRARNGAGCSRVNLLEGLEARVLLSASISGEAEILDGNSYRDGTPLGAMAASPFVLEGTAGDDAFCVRLSADGASIQIWRNGTGEGDPAHTLAKNEVSTLEVETNGGLDTLALDATHGQPLESAGLAVEGAVRLVGKGERVFRVASLEIEAGTTLDLDTNVLELADGEVAEVEGWVQSGRNGGAGVWEGPGIISSAAIFNPNAGVGVAGNGEGVVVGFAWSGDLNVNGAIDADDYFGIDAGFLEHAAAAYAAGDVDYSGATDGDDYALMDAAFMSQSGEPGVVKDPAMAMAVRSAAGLRGDAAVTREAMAGITELRVDGSPVGSLSGLELASNLAVLSITPGNLSQRLHIESLEPLASLPGLEELSLMGAELPGEALATLGQVSSLRRLDLRYAELDDLEFVAMLPNLESVQLHGAACGDLSALEGRAINVDLPAEPLSQDPTIADIAAAMRYSPLELYEYVRNYIAYELYRGQLKGAEGTLASGAGNDWDQATLLIELLEASGIQARYAAGRVVAMEKDLMRVLGTRGTVPTSTLMDLAGLNADVELDFINGNKYTFDHAWVEAYLDVPGKGAQWVALDPSWKFTDWRDGVADIWKNVKFDEAGYLSQVRSELPYEYYVRQVGDWLKTNKPGLAPADAMYEGSIIPVEVDRVPESLPFQPVAATVTTSEEVPRLSRHRVGIELLDATKRLLNYEFDLAEHSLDTINLNWTAGGGGMLTPDLRLDGEVVVAGTAVAAGTAVRFNVVQFEPGDDTYDTFSATSETAGRHLALTIDANQISTSVLREREAAAAERAMSYLNGETTGGQAYVDAFLSLASALWFHEADKAEEVINALTWYKAYPNRVGFAITSAGPTVRRAAELPLGLMPDAPLINVNPDSYDVSTITGGIGDLVKVNRFVLMNGSALEHAIWERLLNIPSMSTVKSFQMANEAGIPLFTLNSSNIETLAPQLTISPGTIAVIRGLVAGGSTVTVPRDPTPLLDWDGVGYLVSASGGKLSFRIAGEANGGTPGGFNPFAPPGIVVGSFPNATSVGDPVNIANGNVTHDEVDVSLPGAGLAMTFARHYDSQATEDVGFGPGWAHAFSDHLAFATDGGITWTTGEGIRHGFTRTPQGTYEPTGTLFGRLSAVEGGYAYRHPDGKTLRFDVAGRLTRIVDRNGNGVALTYDSQNRLTAITDEQDATRRMTLGWSGNRIGWVEAPGQRRWTFAYDGRNRLESTTQPAEVGEEAPVTRYTWYGDTVRGGLLQMVVEPNGGVTTFDYWTDRRARRVTDAMGFAQDFSYDFSRLRTIVADARGRTCTYDYDLDGQLVAMTEPDTSGLRQVWEDGLLKQRIDATGNVESYAYDAMGNLTGEVDRAGRVTTYTYDPVFNQPLTVLRPGGNDTLYAYDERGNAVLEMDGLGGARIYTYDTQGRMLSRTEARGSETADEDDFTTRFTYNASGQVLEIIDPVGGTLRREYDALGNLVREVHREGHATTYEYDRHGRIVKRVDALGGVVRMTYDAAGNLLSIADPLGRVTQYAYDALYRRVETRLADGAVTGGGYDADGKLLWLVNELGAMDQYTRNGAGQALAHVNPLGSTDTAIYDSLKRLVRWTDGLGRVNRSAYDALGHLLTSTDASGKVTAYGYDADGRLVQTTDRLGAVTHFAYDAMGRLAEVRGSEGMWMTYAYDADGNLVGETRYDTDGMDVVPENAEDMPADRRRTRSFAYDELERNIATTEEDPDGSGPLTRAVTRYAYDREGRLVESIGPAGRVTRHHYDALGRLVETIDPAGSSTLTTYDAAGNAIRTVDPVNRVKESGYDQRDRLVWMKDAQGNLTRLGYDAAGQLVSVMDTLGNTTRSVYDLAGRRVAQVNGQGAVARFEYDAVGNLVRQTDENGRVRTWQYSALNQPLVETWLGADGKAVAKHEYTYDAQGQRLTAKGGGTDLTFTYDGVGQLLTSLVKPLGFGSGPNMKLEYDYNSLGQLLSIGELAGGTTEKGTTRYEYDRAGRPVAVSQSGADTQAKRATFAWTEAGELAEMGYFSGDANPQRVGKVVYGYDAMGNVSQIAQTDGAGGVVDTLRYERDGVGRVKKFTNRDGVAMYGYDPLGQVIRVDNSDAGRPDETYTYDAAGNRTTPRGRGGPVLIGAGNQLLRDGLYAYAYDRAGNMVSRTTLGTGAVREMTYDYRNQLTKVVDRTAPGGAATLVVEHTYDALGRLSSTTADLDGDGYRYWAKTTAYVYDRDGVLLTYEGTWPSNPNLSGRNLLSPAGGAALAEERISIVSPQTLWLLGDHLGSVRDVLDGAGVKANHLVYDSWGNLLSQSNTSASPTHRFAAMAAEPSGLYRTQARLYDPGTGRFTTVDPSGLLGGDTNLYRYVGNDPVNRVDPWGLSAKPGGIFKFLSDAGQALSQFGSDFVQSLGLSVGDRINYAIEATGITIQETARKLNDAVEQYTGISLADRAMYGLEAADITVREVMKLADEAQAYWLNKAEAEQNWAYGIPAGFASLANSQNLGDTTTVLSLGLGTGAVGKAVLEQLSAKIAVAEAQVVEAAGGPYAHFAQQAVNRLAREYKVAQTAIPGTVTLLAAYAKVWSTINESLEAMPQPSAQVVGFAG